MRPDVYVYLHVLLSLYIVNSTGTVDRVAIIIIRIHTVEMLLLNHKDFFIGRVVNIPGLS